MSEPVNVELSRRAERELLRLAARDRERIVLALRSLGIAPPPANLDIAPLRGRPPWLRLRVGDFRVLFRPLTMDERSGLKLAGERGYLVARVVNRRELERAVRILPLE
jgi:mRNA-degrading endonuclease RelE of RelBE toxin-antitoxin system